MPAISTGVKIIEAPATQTPIHLGRGNVFNIAPTSDFLKETAVALFNGVLFENFVPKKNPADLARATIYVPSRRAGRELANKFLEITDQPAIILPKIRTLGDIEDEEFGLVDYPTLYPDLPPAIGKFERKFEIAALIFHWSQTLNHEQQVAVAHSPIPTSRANALLLSEELCGLFDSLTLEELYWDEIQKIIPDEFAQWWQLTSQFLAIISQVWPAHLSDKGMIDPALHMAEQLRRRAERISNSASTDPVIVAGSTGSVPSTRNFIKAVQGLENGAIILPGLDLHLSDDHWSFLQNEDSENDSTIETHPNFGLARLLAFLNISREEVHLLGNSTAQGVSRQHFASTILLPSAFTDLWSSPATKPDAAAISNLSIIEATNERQEATAIAIAMREVIETPDKTVALVTPDRNLARRVSSELLRYNIIVDDSAGTPLSETPAAHFIRQILAVAFNEPTAIDLLTLLKTHSACSPWRQPKNKKPGQILKKNSCAGT